MNKKIILTSFIALGFACPAFAESFPNDGYMQENKTYDNAATESNMAGVYEGSVYANAQYEDVLYQLAAGKYLPANSETPIDCNQNGYYCAGDQNGVYYSSSAQGLSQCPNGYANSGTGASANTDCYRACVTGANGDAPHSTGTVNGGVYYDGTSGDGVNACEPTACVNGYHVKAAIPDLITVIGVSGNGTGTGYKHINGNTNTGSNLSTYGITNNGEFVVDYGAKGKIHGYAQCSTEIGGKGEIENGRYSFISKFATLASNTGRACYCRLDGYTASGSNTTIELSGLPWVFSYLAYDESGCASSCTTSCTMSLFGSMSDNRAFRAAVFDTITPSLATCEANTITINWNGTTQSAIDANNAGTATYDGDIRTPASATHIDGKRFTGWIFSTTAPSNGNE